MIETRVINYASAKLEIPTFLTDLWPHALHPADWPTFCGAGDGLGDRIVPDHICSVSVSPCCFEHDISWALAENSFAAFMKANLRLWLNLRSLVLANYNKKLYPQVIVEWRCFGFFLAVSTVGKKFFKAGPEDRIVTADPFDHPIVRARLHRLARVVFKIPGYIDGEAVVDYAN